MQASNRLEYRFEFFFFASKAISVVDHHHLNQPIFNSLGTIKQYCQSIKQTVSTLKQARGNNSNNRPKLQTVGWLVD